MRKSPIFLMILLTFMILASISAAVAQLPETALVMTTRGESRQVITFLDPVGSPETQIPVSGMPANAAPDSVAFFGNDAVLAADTAVPRIFVIRPSTGTLLATISVPTGCSAGMMLVSPDSQYAVTVSGSKLCAIHAPFNSSSTITALDLTGGIGSNFAARTMAMDPNGRVFVRTQTGVVVADAPYTSVAFTMARALSESGTISITPNGQQVLVTHGQVVGSSIYVYNAPFGPDTVPEAISGNTSLSNLTVAPDGLKAIYAINSPFTHVVRSLNAPFQPGTSGQTLTMPEGYGGCSDVQFSNDSSIAVLSNCGNGAPHILVKGPFTTAGAQSSYLPTNQENPNGGDGMAVFLPAQFSTPSAPATTPFDFDGDGRADVSVFRPASGVWYQDRSSAGFGATGWGVSTDTLAPADYDGDGKTDVAIWRANEGAFYVLNSSDGTIRIEAFGVAGDVVTVGDWDGDGKADLSTYREGPQSTFFYRASSSNPTGAVTYVPWGTNGDLPIGGDFDGDGKADAAVFRGSDSTWYIRNSSDGQVRYDRWGLAGDKFATADYDGDGKTDLAVFRNGTWYIKNSLTGDAQYATFGMNGDVPVPADYDGDGRADISIYRGGTWYLMQTTGGLGYATFGTATDKPIANAYVR